MQQKKNPQSLFGNQIKQTLHSPCNYVIPHFKTTKTKIKHTMSFKYFMVLHHVLQQKYVFLTLDQKRNTLELERTLTCTLFGIIEN